MPSGSLREVDVDRARERVGDDERRAREEVLLHVGVDAAFEVAVAREHRDDREVVLVHRVRDAVEQRAGVADAGGAPVSGEVEAQVVERLDESGALEVVGDDAAARSERGLHPAAWR